MGPFFPPPTVGILHFVARHLCILRQQLAKSNAHSLVLYIKTGNTLEQTIYISSFYYALCLLILVITSEY